MTVTELRDRLNELIDFEWGEAEAGTMVGDIGFIPIDFIGLGEGQIHFLEGADPEEEWED